MIRFRKKQRGEVLVLALILLAIFGGGLWYLWSARRINEAAARDFARDAAERIVLHQDQVFLNRALAPAAQVAYPPSWRERLFAHLRVLGPPPTSLDLQGETKFTSHFFDPHGAFRVRINYPENPAFLDLEVSHPRALWQIDMVNLTWTPHVEPTPSPTPMLETPTPTPSPTPKATPPSKAKSKKTRAKG
ncbi:MAG: hypothetical protein ACR2HH_15345 [Chthoniobacterales bacterium]